LAGYWLCRVVVVVVDVVPGGPGGGATMVGATVVVRSVVVRVTEVSEPPQAASARVPVRIAPAVKIRRPFVILLIIALRIRQHSKGAFRLFRVAHLVRSTNGPAI
jgi:hypothetical protein